MQVHFYTAVYCLTELFAGSSCLMNSIYTQKDSIRRRCILVLRTTVGARGSSCRKVVEHTLF